MVSFNDCNLDNLDNLDKECISSASIRTNFKLVLLQAAYKAVVQASNQIFNQKLWYIMVSIQPHNNLPNKFANLC